MLYRNVLYTKLLQRFRWGNVLDIQEIDAMYTCTLYASAFISFGKLYSKVSEVIDTVKVATLVCKSKTAVIAINVKASDDISI